MKNKGLEKLQGMARGIKKRASFFLKKMPKMAGLGGKIQKKIPNKLKQFDINFQDINLKNISEHSATIRWGLTLLAIFLLAQISASIIGIFIRPTFPKITKKTAPPPPSNQQNFQGVSSIKDRNIFNVERNIPDPFETGQMDCFSQAKRTSKPITLLGTIVLDDERYSTALLQEQGSPLKLAVRKDESFFNNAYQAISIKRKKICFQVQASQEMEYLEIPEKPLAMGSATPGLAGGSSSGIKPISETVYEVEKSFLDAKILNLNEILQTARAVPYREPGTGNIKGFLIQTIDPDSPFADLGLRQGDVLTGVNDIVLDHPGKGLEAFQRLKNAKVIDIQIIRGGRSSTLNYTVKN